MHHRYYDGLIRNSDGTCTGVEVKVVRPLEMRSEGNLIQL